MCSVNKDVQATGQPTIVRSPLFAYVYFLGCDGKGNLFLDGYDSNKEFQFGELPAASSSITAIPLSGATISFPSGVQFAQGRLNTGRASLYWRGSLDAQLTQYVPQHAGPLPEEGVLRYRDKCRKAAH